MGVGGSPVAAGKARIHPKAVITMGHEYMLKKCAYIMRETEGGVSFAARGVPA